MAANTSPGADAAALSSITTALDELTARVAAVAERYDHTGQEGLASDLYDVERALRAATRRLTKVQGSL
jgi:hypothetical protein